MASGFWNKLLGRKEEFDSGAYWEGRYRKGRNSGSGSYGRLAEYKGAFVNDLVRREAVASVVELGVGDGNQASLFDFPNYTGVDIVPKVVEDARRQFAGRPGWRFLTSADFEGSPQSHELAMSLDVIYHLVEDEVFERYMRTLVAVGGRFVLIYSSDNDGTSRARHVRHRAYSNWMTANAPQFTELGKWDHPFPASASSNPDDTSFAFFRLYSRTGQ